MPAFATRQVSAPLSMLFALGLAGLSCRASRPAETEIRVAKRPPPVLPSERAKRASPAETATTEDELDPLWRHPNAHAALERATTLHAPSPELAELRLEIGEAGPLSPWTLAIVNVGHREARLQADARLIRLEVDAPHRKKPVDCALPPDMFPSAPDQEFEMVLAPGEAVLESFDPRLYCFSDPGDAVLVPGATVTPRFGWRTTTKVRWQGGKRVVLPDPKPPFVAEALVSDADRDLVRLQEIEGTPFELGNEYALWSVPGTSLDADEPPALELRMVRGSDARTAYGVTVAVELKNTSTHVVPIFFRRELLSFEILGPTDFVTCEPEPDAFAPDRQAFLFLGPGRSASFTSRLAELCPADTFDASGLYLIQARFDAIETDSDLDKAAFVGSVSAPVPASVRIRAGASRPSATRHMSRVLTNVEPE